MTKVPIPAGHLLAERPWACCVLGCEWGHRGHSGLTAGGRGARPRVGPGKPTQPGPAARGDQTGHLRAHAKVQLLTTKLDAVATLPGVTHVPRQGAGMLVTFQPPAHSRGQRGPAPRPSSPPTPGPTGGSARGSGPVPVPLPVLACRAAGAPSGRLGSLGAGSGSAPDWLRRRRLGTGSGLAPTSGGGGRRRASDCAEPGRAVHLYPEQGVTWLPPHS